MGNPVFGIFLVILVCTSSYAFGRLHAHVKDGVGWRFGYRDGFAQGKREARQQVLQRQVATPVRIGPGPRPRNPRLVNGAYY